MTRSPLWLALPLLLPACSRPDVTPSSPADEIVAERPGPSRGRFDRIAAASAEITALDQRVANMQPFLENLEIERLERKRLAARAAEMRARNTAPGDAVASDEALAAAVRAYREEVQAVGVK